MCSKPSHVGIVDDDPDGAELVALRLTREGYRASIVHDAQVALRTFQSDPVDLLLLDYCLPGGQTGLDLFERFQEIRHAPPAILITGYTDGEVLLEAWRRGLNGVVIKTVDFLDDLVDRVRITLEKADTDRCRAANDAVRSAIVDSSPLAIIASDEHDRILLVNHAAKRLLRCTADQIAGRPLTEFLPATAMESLRTAPAASPSTSMVRRVDGDDVVVEAECWHAVVEERPVRVLLLRPATMQTPAQLSDCIAE